MTERLRQAFQHQEFSFEQIADLAPFVKQLSDQYVTAEGSLTPWSSKELALAYLAYFMPLNGARLANAWREVVRMKLSEQISEIWDVGSGPGTLHWVLEDSSAAVVPLFSVERASEAIQWHKTMTLPNDRWRSEWSAHIKKPRAGALGVFSYSLLEMPSTRVLDGFDHLLILEPSTQSRSRRLMELRDELKANGYHLLAPCTHQLGCPLLLQSSRDWCHQRFEWHAPEWWKLLEDQLPMKNRTLTYSYLLASRLVAPRTFAARVIGDTLFERGKVRQMICRGEQREFLSWLSREGEPPQIPHGAVLNSLPDFEMKSNELRVRGLVDWQN